MEENDQLIDIPGIGTYCKLVNISLSNIKSQLEKLIEQDMIKSYCVNDFIEKGIVRVTFAPMKYTHCKINMDINAPI